MTKKRQQIQKRTSESDVLAQQPPEIVQLIVNTFQANSELARRVEELEGVIDTLRGGDVATAYNAGIERGAWMHAGLFEAYLIPVWGAMVRAEVYMQQIKAAVLAGRGELARAQVGELVEPLGKELAVLDNAWAKASAVLYIEIDREPVTTFYELARDYASGKTNEKPLLNHIATMGEIEAAQVWRRADHAPGARAFPARWHIARRADEIREAARGEHDTGRVITWEQVARRLRDNLAEKMRTNRASDLEREAYNLLTTQGNLGDYVRSAVSDYRRRGGGAKRSN